jgi:hypothetical protein
MLRRSLLLAVAALVFVSACAATNQPATKGPLLVGDGAPDCADGEVTRGTDISVSAETEMEAVEAALKQWTDEGADVVEFDGVESWSATLNGREVATAVPELGGDGVWVVQDVQTCGTPETGPAAIDGVLDCANEYRWSMQAGIDPTIPGVPTPEEAITQMLEGFKDRYGGEIVLVDDLTGSLVVNSREQVVTTASESPAGGWTVLGAAGCEGFELP